MKQQRMNSEALKVMKSFVNSNKKSESYIKKTKNIGNSNRNLCPQMSPRLSQSSVSSSDPDTQ